ncbi:glycosyltransferase family 4 protein [Sulfurovum sp. zt1-1]|uniref:Glycosyltransferase family 4 protein n=1 Tax=Sulfurovum zhangzhouensis TaxID=3019067 RepID=A0ABT7R0C8_9BACT|nr:glycosyltransferase family 4 protein [Sulfurovum zhangzhouensis]MDM5272549.1 glycosyltransferase family 4 protein [Sulfurovum zhangzhouensis]
MNKKIKIAYLDQSKIFSGAENSLKDLITHLDNDRFVAVIIFPYPQEHHKRYERICELKYLNNSTKWWMGSDRWKKPIRGTDLIKRIITGFQLAFWSKKNNIDIVHVNLCEPKSFWWGFWLKKFKIKSILHIRSEEKKRLPNENTQKQYDCILTVSKYVKKRVQEKYKHKHINAIYDSVDFTLNENLLTKNELYEKLNINIDKKLISSVGMLQQIKNHEMAIKAFHQLNQEFDNYILLIAGGGLDSELIRLKKIVNALDLKDNVIFTEKQIDFVNSVYKHSEFIFSLTLPGEAFGRVPFEALKFYTPTIVPSEGAALELFEDMKNGFVASPKSLDEVLEKARFILNNKEKTLEIINNAYKKFSKLLDPKIYVEHISEYYYELSKIK